MPDQRPELPPDPDATADDVRRPPWDVLGVIAIGGAAGSVARWGLAEALPHTPAQVPWGTVVVNVTGCLAIGVLLVVLAVRFPDRRLLRPLLGTGVLGGYTTFSTYALDSRTLAAAGRPALAAAYLVGTLVAGLLAVVVGIRLAERMLR